MVGEFFGGLFGGASALASQYLGYKYAKKLQNHQYDLNQKALQSYYTNHRTSLESAGYNPLLNVPGSSAQGFNASATAPGADVGEGIQAGVNTALAVKQTKANVENTEADTDIKKYGKIGAILKNLLNIGKDKELSKNPIVQKVLTSEIVNMSKDTNSASSYLDAYKSFSNYKNWFAGKHPTTYKLLQNLKHKDFQGVRDAIKGYSMRGQYSPSSAISFQKHNPYLDNTVHKSGQFEYQYIKDIDKYDDWERKHRKR